MSKSITGVIDYGVGNIRSVCNAVSAADGTPLLTSDHDKLRKCDRLILPGVGAYSHGMSELKSRGLINLIKEMTNRDVPLLGICLGMQMLANTSLEFGKTQGLGFVDGVVDKLNHADCNIKLRLPHVDWKPIDVVNNSHEWLFKGVDSDAKFYFIHSYALPETAPHLIAKAEYNSINFAAIVANKNIIGTQFHPEKSGVNGLQLIKNFLDRG